MTDTRRDVSSKTEVWADLAPGRYFQDGPYGVEVRVEVRVLDKAGTIIGSMKSGEEFEVDGVGVQTILGSANRVHQLEEARRRLARGVRS